MANVSRGIILNPSSNNATDEGVHLDLTERVGLITQIILTTLIFPLTILLNLLITLVRKTPRTSEQVQPVPGMFRSD